MVSAKVHVQHDIQGQGKAENSGSGARYATPEAAYHLCVALRLVKCGVAL